MSKVFGGLMYKSLLVHRGTLKFLFLFIPLVALLLLKFNEHKNGCILFMIAITSQEITTLFVFQLVNERSNQFKVTFKIAGMQSFTYIFAQFISLISILIVNCCCFLIGSAFISLYTKSYFSIKDIISILLINFFYSSSLSALTLMQSFLYKKSEFAKNLSRIISNCLFSLGFYGLINKKFNFLHWLNPFQCLIEFLSYEITLPIPLFALSKPQIFLALTIQIFIFFVLSTYFEYVLPRDGSLGRSILFFLESFNKKQKNNNFSEELDTAQENLQGLSVRKLFKSFGQNKVLIDINYFFTPGKLYTILGHNGAGKSTFINVLTGIYSPDRGIITYNGDSFYDSFKDSKIRVGVCPSSDYLFENLTVYEHLRMAAMLKNLSDSSQKAIKIIKIFKIEEHAQKKAIELSGGTRRKLLLAMALIENPQVLFLDEPTTGLDPISRQDFWIFVEKMKKQSPNLITLLATHHLEEAERLSEEVLILAGGKIISSGSIDFVKSKFGAGITFSLFPKSNIDYTILESTCTDLKNSFPQLEFYSNLNKLENKTPIKNIQLLEELLLYVKKNLNTEYVFSVNSNTLEKAYLDIEETYSSSLILKPEFLSDIFPRSSPNFALKVILLAKQALVVQVSDYVNFATLISSYIIITFTTVSLMKLNDVVEFQLLIYIVDTLFSNSDTFSDTFPSLMKLIIYTCITIQLYTEFFSTAWIVPLIKEKQKQITSLLYVNGISPLQYYLSKLLSHAILQLILYSFIYKIYQVYLSQNQEKTILLLIFFKIYLWRLANFTQDYLISKFFATERIWMMANIFIKFFFLIISVFLVFLYKGEFFLYLSIYTALGNILTNQDFGYLKTSVLFGSFIILNLTLLYLWEEWNLHYNLSSDNSKNNSKQLLTTDLLKNSVLEEEKEVLENQNLPLRSLRLSKKYNKNFSLKKVTFGISPADSFGLVGQNGAGKSTIFGLLLGKIRKTSGQVSYRTSGFPLRSFPFDKLRFAVCFQENNIWEDLSVRRHLNFYFELFGCTKKGLDSLLRYFEFESFMDINAEDLSAGNKRKLCMIISILRVPEFLFFDEATAGVDIIMRQKIKVLLDCLKENYQTVILQTTHFLKDVEFFCNKVGIMREGQFFCVQQMSSLKLEMGGYIVKLNLNIKVNQEEILKSFSKFGKISSLNVNEKEKTIYFVINNINESFGFFSLLIDLQKDNRISSFSINQLSFEDIYVNLMNMGN